MNEKEIKKIDEKGEEEVSGGLKISKDKRKKILIQGYGALDVFRLDLERKKLRDKENEKDKKPEEALTPSQPQTEEKK